MRPDNPFLLGRTPNLASSNGFEGMALSADGKTLYPFLEGPLVGDDPTASATSTSSTSRTAATPAATGSTA